MHRVRERRTRADLSAGAYRAAGVYGAAGVYRVAGVYGAAGVYRVVGAYRAAVVCLAAGVCLSGCGAGRITVTPVRETGVAASCAALSPAARFAAARRVFVGTMLPGPTARLGGRRVLASPARMRVTRYLKGHGPSDVTVLTAVMIHNHGVTVAEDRIEPRAGERWKIYTGSRGQPFDTSMCAGSGRVGT